LDIAKEGKASVSSQFAVTSVTLIDQKPMMLVAAVELALARRAELPFFSTGASLPETELNSTEPFEND
jgi:hypothetical protein